MGGNEELMPRRIEGFEYVRAVMSVFVVCWHMKASGYSLIFSARYGEHVFIFSDFVNFHLFMLAVPSFIFISTYLYALQGAGAARLWKRLKRLFILFTFWPISFIIFIDGYKGLDYLVPKSLSFFVLTVLQAGGTIYYFFASLMICLILTWIIAGWTNTWLWIGFVLAVLVLVILPGLTERTDIYSLSAYWSPLNFLAYPFAAVLFVRNREAALDRQVMIFWAAVACCIIFAVLEWNYAVKGIYFTHQGFALPPYTRPSVVFGVAAVAVLALRPAIQSNYIIRFMAGNTLALYCLHIFFSPIIRLHVESFTQNTFLLTYGSIILTICWSYVLAAVLKNYLKQNVLM